jgi:hypothetical protein
MGMLLNLAAKSWIVGGIGVSLLWFAAGRQMSAKKQHGAMGWQAIAVIIALIVCGRSAVEREWLGVVGGIVAVCFELRSIRRSILNSQRQ